MTRRGCQHDNRSVHHRGDKAGQETLANEVADPPSGPGIGNVLGLCGSGRRLEQPAPARR